MGSQSSTSVLPDKLPAETSRVSSHAFRPWLVISIPLLVIAAFASGFNKSWAHFDDGQYIRENRLLWDADGLKRIWLTSESDQYYPITFSSFWLEYRLWGLWPAGFFATNIALHALNAVLLFYLARALGAAPIVSWLAACLFGIHPIQVASVAWLAERKNVLSGAFALASALLYLRAERTARWQPYAGALACFLLGLLSKTAIVTLPFSLWAADLLILGRPARRAFLRILPMVAIGTLCVLITILMEMSGPRDVPAMPVRVLMGTGALWFYLYKLLIPWPLVAVYPTWPVTFAFVPYWLALAGAIAVGAALVRWRGKLDALLLWCAAHYLIMLVPALGFLWFDFLRLTAVADHLAYLAVIGPMLALALGIDRAFRSVAAAQTPRLVYAAAILLIAVFGFLTFNQAQIWRNGINLWSHTLSYNPACALCHNNLGYSYRFENRADEALEQYRLAVQLEPRFWIARTNYGAVLRELGRVDEAIAFFEESRALAPHRPEVHFNLAYAYECSGNLEKAVEHYREAVRLDPGYPQGQTNLGLALRKLGRQDDAIAQLQQGLANNPADPVAHFNLGTWLADAGRFDEAIQHYRESLRIQPDAAAVHTNLGLALMARQDIDGAIASFRKSLELNENDARAHLNLGGLLAQRGMMDQAERHFRSSVRIDPSTAEAQNNLGTLLAQRGRFAESLPFLKEAIRLRPEHANAHFMLGLALAATKDHAGAIEQFRAAIEVQPNDAEAHYRLGLSFEASGNPTDAAMEYRKAAELAPAMKEAVEARKRVEK